MTAEERKAQLDEARSHITHHRGGRKRLTLYDAVAKLCGVGAEVKIVMRGLERVRLLRQGCLYRGLRATVHGNTVTVTRRAG